MNELIFPGDFAWGTATASYQIEGHPLADGAAQSIWHEFSHKPGNTHSGDTGDVACDHYHRYPEDIGHMKDLGIGVYRFSAAWPRIIPEPGKINRKGIDFYSRLTDALLEAGIEPMCTLFHWDAPVWLEEIGGFTSRESVDHFLLYAETMFTYLGDRIKRWISINEPMVFTVNGYHTGEFAPGHKFDLNGLFRAAHFLLLAHAESVRMCRDKVKGGSLGIAEAQVYISPSRGGNERDIRAALTMDAIANRLYIDPIFRGVYPELVLRSAEKRLPEGWDKDLSRMKEPGDFVGINYYMKRSYKYAWYMPLTHAVLKDTPGAERSEMWEVYPEGLYLLLKRLKEEYGNPPCWITENGYPLPEEDGPVLDDEPRIRYLERHIAQVHRALAEGVDVRGYLAWSLLDNFEWNLGNRMRFGLIRTDFETLERSWKRSAYWYRDLVSSGRLVEGERPREPVGGAL
jgi:beta-glucosidase